jgi:predicted chitinase
MRSIELFRRSLLVLATAAGLAWAGASGAATASGNGLACGATTWTQGKPYSIGDVVEYNGGYYVATKANPGYSPTISTWYWAPIVSGCTTPPPPPSSSCSNASAWQDGKSYAVGDVVSYNGSYYVATHANPGYTPTVSTWYWSPQSCSTTPATPSTGTTPFERIVSRAMFDSIFPQRNSFYTYDGLVTAAKIYPGFASSGSVTAQKREVAAFLAQVTHETGALVYIEQIVKSNYCDSTPSCPCASGKRYYGRGPLQLSWNGNYCDASQVMFGDPNTLRLDPDRMAREAWVAWGGSLWFWMTRNGAGRMTAHDAMVNDAGYGETIRTINGAQECNGGDPPGIQSRVDAYKRICSLLGVTPGTNLTC